MVPPTIGPPDVLEDDALEEDALDELDEDDAPDVELAELDEELESDEPELEDDVESTVLSSKQPAVIVIIARLGMNGVILKRETMGPLAVGRRFPRWYLAWTSRDKKNPHEHWTISSTHRSLK